MHRLGVMHLELHEAGARIEEDAYLHLGKRVRLVQGAGRYLSDVKMLLLIPPLSMGRMILSSVSGRRIRRPCHLTSSAILVT